MSPARPVFVDIDPKTLNMDPQKLEKAIDEVRGGEAVNDPNYAYWHSASFSNDGKKVYVGLENADIPGLADRERMIVARIARYHRRSPPDRSRARIASRPSSSTPRRPRSR